MDMLPIPDYSDYFETLRQSTIAPYVSPGLLIETSRGCWWGQKHRCTFCGLNGEGVAYRSKSPSRVIDEFARLSDYYGLRQFEVVDNILDYRYFQTVLPQLADIPESYATFFETKANLKREQLEILVRAGVRWIQPGIESMHLEVLKRLNKGNTVWMNLQLLKWALELGICVEWLFLWGAPGEADEWYGEMAEWLPMIVHLQPPAGLARIEYDRFSPYQQHPEEYGISLAANKNYRYVYPVTTEDAEDLAYFFECTNEEECHLDPTGNQAPGLNAWLERMKEWRLPWIRATSKGNGSRPQLSIRQDERQWTVVDTRPCAVDREFTVCELGRSVIRACDCAQRPGALTNTVARMMASELTWDDLRPVVDELRIRGILLELDEWFLSLAVTGDHPPLPTGYPGGEVYIQRLVRDKVLAKHAKGTVPAFGLSMVSGS
jgi:magnesium-protoporphyrin IX monomethyl ester (oxidative) cyclase